MPSGEKIEAKYFDEKSELLDSLNNDLNAEDLLRSIISIGATETQQEKDNPENNVESHSGQNNLLNNFKSFLNQQDNFKQILSSSFSVYMSSLLNQNQSEQTLSNQVLI